LDRKSQAKRILANVVDFDMHNLFPPRTFMENLEDASSGEFTSQPQKTLRERPYGTQPLMVTPKYEGDFLKKLRKPELEGKPVMPLENVVNVYAANPNNLWDFSMPSEWLKHQERPFPRNLVDLYYETNRPGEGVGEKTLDEYHDRGWDADDAPEMSEDKPIRRGPFPGKPLKVPFHSASKRVVASYLSEFTEKDECCGPNVGIVVASYLMNCVPSEFIVNFENIKTAMLLEGLEESRIDSKTKGLHKLETGDVVVRPYRNSPKQGKWIFKTFSGPRPPAAIEWPYTTTFEFIPHGREKRVNKLHVRTSCTCPSWLFWGAQYNATMQDYRYGPIRPKFAPPDKRDKRRKFLACKHIIACIPYLVGTGQRGKFTDEGFSLHMIDVPVEKRKRIIKAPKFQIMKKAPIEELRIPQELMKAGKKPEVRSIVSEWKTATPRLRKSMLKKLDDVQDVSYIAHRFPESATHLVAERLKEIGDKTKQMDVKKDAVEEIKVIEKIEDKVEKALPEVPAELSHFEDDEKIQNLLKDIKETPGWERKSTLLKEQDDADALAYMAIALYREDFDESVNIILEKLSDMVKEKGDPKAKKWSEYIY